MAAVPQLGRTTPRHTEVLLPKAGFRKLTGFYGCLGAGAGQGAMVGDFVCWKQLNDVQLNEKEHTEHSGSMASQEAGERRSW